MMAVTQVDGRFRTLRLRLSNQVVRQLNRLWLSTGAVGDVAVQDQFVARASELLGGGQRQTARLTGAYLAAKAREAGDGVEVTLDASRYVDLQGPESLYSPFGAVGHQLREGADREAAFTSGQARLQRVATTGLQMAHVRAAQDWMRQVPGVAGYRRVLGAGKSCGLCVVASTQRYRTGQLAPIHERCKCTVSPIWGTEDVGQVVDSDRLKAVRSRLQADSQPYTRQGLSRLDVDPSELPTVEVVDSDIGPRLYDRAWRN